MLVRYLNLSRGGKPFITCALPLPLTSAPAALLCSCVAPGSLASFALEVLCKTAEKVRGLQECKSR